MGPTFRARGRSSVRTEFFLIGVFIHESDLKLLDHIVPSEVVPGKGPLPAVCSPSHIKLKLPLPLDADFSPCFSQCLFYRPIINLGPTNSLFFFTFFFIMTSRTRQLWHLMLHLSTEEENKQVACSLDLRWLWSTCHGLTILDKWWGSACNYGFSVVNVLHTSLLIEARITPKILILMEKTS